MWCRILELVRTAFVTCDDEEVPRENPERRQSRTNNNFKFFFGEFRFTEILTNFSLGGRLFILSNY